MTKNVIYFYKQSKFTSSERIPLKVFLDQIQGGLQIAYPNKGREVTTVHN